MDWGRIKSINSGKVLRTFPAAGEALQVFVVMGYSPQAYGIWHRLGV